MRTYPRALLLIALPLFTAGCPTEPAQRVKEAAAPEDEWSRIPPSKEWLHATGDFSGDHKGECDHVLPWVKGEDRCATTLCEHGRDLAAEWVTRCTSYAPPALVEEVKALRGRLIERAALKPTECGKQLEGLLREGCGADKTCEVTGQRWATRCAKAEGTPLVMRILQKTIERKLPEPAPVKLDPRTCDELRAEVGEAGRCKDRFACSDAAPKIEAYRARCESDDERPTIAIAVAQLSVLVGGGRPAEPILVRQNAAAIIPEEVGVALADGSGGVISVCEERASDLERYYGARKGCQAGRMVVARAFKGSRGIEVRAGAIDFPDDATFLARYPTLLAAREQELRDRDALAQLTAELGKAVELGKTPAGAAEAARVLAKAVIANTLAIKRSPQLRVAITSRDDGLVPAMRELAKLKVAAVKGKVDPGEASGLAVRGKTRAFADVAADGTVQLGAATRASTLETASLLPKAMEAYLTALKGARPRKPDAKAVKAERAKGMSAALSCGGWERKLQESKQALVSCNFGIEACDAARAAALVKALDEAAKAAEGAFHQLDHARTGAAIEAADEITRAADNAGCREPWW